MPPPELAISGNKLGQHGFATIISSKDYDVPLAIVAICPEISALMNLLKNNIIKLANIDRKHIIKIHIK
jgi:hypothetical protein